MAAIEVVGSIESVLKLARAQQELPANDELAQKFTNLMQPAPGSLLAGRPDFDTPAVNNDIHAVSDVMAKHETVMREAFSDAESIGVNASSMSMSELVVANIDVSRRMAVASVGMQSVSALGQTANKSLQSLLKNQ
jgi:hypothetical protein